VVGTLEAAIQAAVDGVIVAGLGHVPVIGELFAPEAVAEVNKGLAFVENHLGASAADLLDFVQAKLSAVTEGAPKPLVTG
jgi:hypothetical protein